MLRKCLLLLAFTACAISQFSGTTEDCDTVDRCPPVELVFVVDTSSSMNDLAQSLCNTIDDVVTSVAQLLSIDVNYDILGIARYGQDRGGTSPNWNGAKYPCPGPAYYTPSGCDASIPSELCPDFCWQEDIAERFRCLSSDVETLYYQKGLTSLPGNSTCVWPMPATCGYPGPSSIGQSQAEAINPSCNGCYTKNECVSQGDVILDSNQGEIVVPVSDEGPCNGGGGVCYNDIATGIHTQDEWNFHGQPTCCSGATDDSDVQNLIAIAQEERIIVSPITGEAGLSATACIDAYGAIIANRTGGFTGSTANASSLDERMTQIITDIIVDACNKYVWSCDDRDPCTIRETCQFSTSNATNSSNATDVVDCVGICICENNCEDVSSFSVPEDDIDVGGGDGNNEATAIGAGVGAGVVGLMLLLVLAAIFIVGLLVLVAIVVIVVILQATGVIGSSATVVAQAFVDGGASFNPTYQGLETEGTNPLFGES